MTTLSFTFSMLALLGLAACDSDSKKVPPAGAVAPNTYVIINDQCYHNGTGAPVADSFCEGLGDDNSNDDGSDSGDSPFQFNDNGECVEVETGIVYLDFYCDPPSGGGGTLPPSTPQIQQCRGWYFVPSYGNYSIYCNGYNCRGYMLIHGITGQPVYCQ